MFDPEATYILTITGDVNDGDYATEHHHIKGKHLPPIVAVFKRVCKRGEATHYQANWDAGERARATHPKEMHGLTDEEYQTVEDLMPYFEGRAIHSLVSVTVKPLVEPLWAWTGKE
jgi:hypothetical protein